LEIAIDLNLDESSVLKQFGPHENPIEKSGIELKTMINDVPKSMLVRRSKSWLSFTASVIGICEKIKKEPISSTIANKIPCEFVGKLL